MLVVRFRGCVNFGVKWWLWFGSDSYIRVKIKMATILRLGLR
jgi:hypothetical protein